jgi:hypothetical protein
VGRGVRVTRGIQQLLPRRRFDPLARDLPGRDVEPVPDVDDRDRQDQRGQLLLVISSRSLSRVTASVKASAARSASVKYGASRQAERT